MTSQNKLIFKRITQPTVAIYDPNGELIGLCVNEIEFLDILSQIKDLKLEGYSVSMYPENEKGRVPINKYGRCRISKELGIYNEHSELLRKIMGF